MNIAGRKPEIVPSNDVIVIPDHVDMDTLITMISIRDPDVGDYVHNVELDYANDYFYFDTQLREFENTDSTLSRPYLKLPK